MRVTFASGNRITVPKEVREQLNLKAGTKLELDIVDGNIVLSTKLKEQKVKDVKPKTIPTKPRKIESNLDKAQNYSKKYYSPCKLVIRTKNAYLKEFCEDCKGQLVDQEHSLIRRECPYRKMPTTNIIAKLTENVEKLNKQIDTEVSYLEKVESSTYTEKDIKRIIKQSKQVIHPVNHQEQAIQCKECGLYFNTGFMVGGKFYCKSCAIKNFQEFLNKYNDMKKKELIK